MKTLTFILTAITILGILTAILAYPFEALPLLIVLCFILVIFTLLFEGAKYLQKGNKSANGYKAPFH